MTQTANQGSVGYGQQDPNDSSNRFNSVAFAVRQMMARIETMMPVKVLSVTGGGGAIAAAGTVSVQPLVNQIDGQGNASPHGQINGIPWWRLQGGTGAVIADPKEGDFGYIIAAARDISAVKQTPGIQNPGSFRKHNYADGIYVGGVFNQAPKQYLAFSDQGITIADSNGNVIKFSSSGIEIDGNVTLKGNLAVQGNITATGEITRGLNGADQVTLGHHTHSTAGNGPPSAPTPGT